MESPPIKPPRGVKPAKEIGGLLMSVIRTLSASETNEQRDKEKSKLEHEYRICDQKLNDLVQRQENDLTKVRFLFSGISQIVSENRVKIAKVKENLQDCKKKLHCRKDELRGLWKEGLQYKHMLQLLDEIEKMNQVPMRLNEYMANKQYLHATKLLVEAVTLGKDTLEGVDSLKELNQELEQKKEQLHLQLIAKLKECLFTRPAQQVLALRRHESGQFQREGELRLSARNRQLNRALFTNANLTPNKQKEEDEPVEDDLKTSNPEENIPQFIPVLLECLALLDKLPLAICELQNETPVLLSAIADRTSLHLKHDLTDLQPNLILVELVQTLFDQYQQIAEIQVLFLSKLPPIAQRHQTSLQPYNLHFYWTHVQTALQLLLNQYLDNENVKQSPVVDTTATTNLSHFFSKRKVQPIKKGLFKLDSSSSALTLNQATKQPPKVNQLVCEPTPNNILQLYAPCTHFVHDLEAKLPELDGGKCQLSLFLTDYVSNVFLKRQSEAIIDEIELAVRAPDAWSATTLLDSTSDYKPLLLSTVRTECSIRKWQSIQAHLPNHSDRIAVYTSKALKNYHRVCLATYQQMARGACSATWLRDDDISRFLQSLPNWLSLKAELRNERMEEESPEEVRMRNRREAEILAGNLGEGGVGVGEIVSDMGVLRELAQLQESMEWFGERLRTFEGLLAGPVAKFDELANTCLLLLHLEVRVQCFHYLLARQALKSETHEADPKVLELSRVLANVDEAMTSCLHPRKCKYIFEGLGHLIAKILIGSAQYLQAIDEVGIGRMCRNVFALQQTLTNITMMREVALDHARHYFELFFMTAEEVLNGIVEKGPEFSELEYMNALQLLHRSGRGGGGVNVHLERLSDILGEVGKSQV